MGLQFKKDKERGTTLDGEEINGDHSCSAWVQWKSRTTRGS